MPNLQSKFVVRLIAGLDELQCCKIGHYFQLCSRSQKRCLTEHILSGAERKVKSETIVRREFYTCVCRGEG